MLELPVTFADLLILLVLLTSAVQATMHGLLQLTLSYVAWVVAGIATLRFYPVFQPIAQANIELEWAADAAAIVGLFLIIMIPLSFISYRVTEGVKKAGGGPLDRALGFVFGLGRGLIVLAVAYILLIQFLPEDDQPAWIQQARLLPLVQETGNILLSIAPDDGATRTGRSEDTYNRKDRDELNDLINQGDR
jgi:membrane protein required for colicin V production